MNSREKLLELYQPRLTIDEIAKAAEVPVATLRYWFQQGWINPSDNDLAGRKGIATRLSLATAIRLAIAIELVGYGIKPSHALNAAGAFSDSNATDVDENLKRISMRSPGALFSETDGQTFLLCWKPLPLTEEELSHPTLLSSSTAMVMAVRGKALPFGIFDKMTGPRMRQDSYIPIWVNRTARTIARQLGVSAVYSEELESRNQ